MRMPAFYANIPYWALGYYLRNPARAARHVNPDWFMHNLIHRNCG